MRINNWILERENGEEVDIDTPLVDFRFNDDYKLLGGTPPHKPGSTGKVYVSEGQGPDKFTSTYYPGVFKLRWRKIDEA